MSVIVSDRRTLVVGLGKTGLSCLRYLVDQGRSVAVADSRSAPPGLETVQRDYPDVPVQCGAFDADWFAGFNELVVSPGVSIQTPAIRHAREHGAVIRGDIDLFSEAAEAPILAITGSNGKTTVTTLVGEMARAAGKRVAVGGNIGTPALELLSPEVDVYVLEVSSFQLETTDKLGADVATVLNVSDDHMDRYPSKMAYFEAKQRIYNGCRQPVVNLDDALSIPLARDDLRFLCFGFHRINPETFSTRDDEGHLWITYGFDNLIRSDELKLLGTHNLSNVMAALAIGFAAGFPMDTMLQVARDFPGLPHRCQRVADIRGVTWVNDSKGTNVGATVAALSSLQPADGRIVLIAGGDGKGADFSPLVRPVRESCRHLILMGCDAQRLGDALSDIVTVSYVDTMDEAVSEAARIACAGDRVLLSPACASLDMYEDYQVRGDAFVRAVEALS
ncbi:UDP-N-acetylmuramoylalanine--D-glutamate ligase [Tamilnaduibacter salinus]|uniref:UDP-N-acetylmuramoylalanine--D-glutamate ligase n=1 Tax=Tamilnaduibacter salinus TaxID=1484056 RepID=A0A2U1D0C2_9GAMM|nr:UDP-N-acetylmuramoyl-L-alanine--D-glutamate ligase [Tamilnaduibacter salinus]PVY78824.1 UDP-N-acetylmuramoylalanine--D-glutamate ligase [Tamilnaduibacter salinus]